MLKEHTKIVSSTEIFVDYLLAIIPIALLLFISNIAFNGLIVLSTLLYPVLKILCLKYSKLYESRRYSGFLSYYFKLGRSLVLYHSASLLLMGLAFLFFKTSSMLSFTITFIVLDTSISMIKSFFALLTIYFVRYYGYNTRNVLLVGEPNDIIRAYKFLKRKNRFGLTLAGYLSEYKIRFLSDLHYYGKTDMYDSLNGKLVMDEVVFLRGSHNRRSLQRQRDSIQKHCQSQGLRFSVFNVTSNSFDLKESISDRDIYLKDTFDMVVSSMLFIIFLPLMSFIALLIKISSKGSVFFTQTRVGKNGRVFKLYKFRTMVEGADAQKKDLLQFNEMSGPVFKMKKDPRVTKLGRILRKSSLDELPQLINVLKGEMSLVGPRPPVPEEVSKYKSKHHKRLAVKPGITCIWQVSGRNNISDFENWVKLDAEYVDNRSFMMDMKILIKTLPALINRRGAQ